MSKKNICYAQSGGVTAVINATACGLIETARQQQDKLGKVYAGENGIIGVLNNRLIDTSYESDTDIAKLRYTPAGAFGSCRLKLKDPIQNPDEFQQLYEVFKANDIGYFFYNGGGDSQDTTHKISQFFQSHDYPLTCIGIPKTIDNDLPITDNCPGFGSVAKYIATSIREAGMDVFSMSASSTKVFILEVMGRHAGWIAAAGGLAAETQEQAPHIILFPEVPLDKQHFLERVDACVKQYGFCALVVSEGLRDQQGEFVAASGLKDAFGHAQLGGVAPTIANLIQSELGYKYHWAVSDYLQRAARHIASKTDVDQAYALGKAAIEQALAGAQDVMLTIDRIPGDHYQWKIGQAPLADVANIERKMPTDFITEDGFHITDKCRDYLSPLIQGEDFPPFKNGLPDYVRLKNKVIDKIV